MATNEVTVEDVFDAGMNVVGDGIGGYAAGKAFNSYTSGKTGGSPSSNSKTSSTTNLIRCRRAAGAGCTTVNGVNQQPATNLNKPSPFNPNPNPSPFNPNPIPRPATPSSSSSSYAGRTFSDGTFTDVSSVSSNISPRMSIQIQPPAVQLPPKISAHTYTIQALSASLPVGVKPPVNMGIAGPATKVAVGVNAAVGTKVDSHNPVQTNPVLVEVVNFDRQRKRKVLCNSQPEIRNRDKIRMSACVGKRPNAKCDVHCRVGYRANRNRVRCVRTGVKDARWDIQNIECVPDGDVICRDGYNNPVDWFIMYRLPLNDPLPGTGLVKGDSFLFMSSRTPESYLLEGNTTTWTDWELSGLEPMDNTLQPIREDTRRIIRANNPNPLQYVMYNDAPPIGNAGGAHAKGIFASRNNLGFYLPHSLPRYPEANGNRGHPSTVYGQVFTCVSLSGQAELAKVAKHLIEIQANVYSRGGPSLTDMSDGAPILMHRRVSLSSRGQTQFDLFTKSPTDNIDIWSAAISDWYGDPMQIVTWIRGEGRLRSVCPDIPNPDPEDAGKLAVENVRRLRFATDVDQEDVEAVFRSSEDHSKWGVGKGSRDNVFCVGDLDRMQSQFIKGGGALCFRNRQVAGTFRDMVVATDCNIE